MDRNAFGAEAFAFAGTECVKTGGMDIGKEVKSMGTHRKSSRRLSGARGGASVEKCNLAHAVLNPS
jgi:hypothetical protein